MNLLSSPGGDLPENDSSILKISSDGWGEQLPHWIKRGFYRDYAHKKIILEQYRKGPFRSMLDVGCGNGILIDFFSRHSVFAIGMDTSPAVLEFHGKQTHLRVVGGDALSLPFASSLFELVACLGLLEHFQDEKALLEELKRVTKKGGRAVISVPSLYSVFPILVPFWYFTGGRYKYGWRELVGKMYTKKEFHRTLSDAGWQVEAIFPFKAGSILDWIYFPFSERIGSWVEDSGFIRKIMGIMLCAICYLPGD